MTSKIENFIKQLVLIDDRRLRKAICRLGCGGDGSVYLHEMEKDGITMKVAVKSVTKNDSLWLK